MKTLQNENATWMKTIQGNLTFLDLELREAMQRTGSESTFLERCALVVMLATIGLD